MASSSGHQPDFVALNRGRYLCSAGQPSRWALAHISSYLFVCVYVCMYLIWSLHVLVATLSLPLPRRICNCCRTSVCLSVCLSATLHKNYWTDVHEIFREGWQQANDQIKFWLRSASQIQIVALVRRALVEVYTFSVLLLFERPFVKQFALCSRTVVCPVLSACDIAVLWPNS